MKSILNFSTSRQIVFLRVDFNVPIKNNVILDTKRIDEVISTILYIVNNNNKLVLCSHLGRPTGAVDIRLSLKIVFEYLKLKVLNKKIHFVDNIFSHYNDVVANAEFGEIIFIENIRFYQEEESNNLEFKKFLRKNIDVYCNEAFSCSHRAHSSIMMAELFESDSKFCGFLFKKEIEALDNFVFKNIKIKSTVVIGGSKISTKLFVIEKLQAKANAIMIVGAMANTLLHYQGYNIGKSLIEKNREEMCKKILNHKECKIILPRDFIVTDDYRNPTRIEKKNLSEILDGDFIVDIGSEGVMEFIEIVKSSEIFLWNGPFGLFEVKPFDNGTKEFAKGIIKLTELGKIKSIVGGGDTLSALKEFDLGKFSHTSTGGGAFLEYIELNNEICGIKALKSSSNLI